MGLKKQALKQLKFIMILVGIIILGLLLNSIGWSKFIKVIGTMDPLLILLAFIPWLLSLCVSALRLKTLIRSNLKFLEVFRIFVYGYLLNYASAIQGIGAGAKVGMLKMKKISLGKSSASVGLEFVYDIFLTFIISSIFFVTHIDFVLNTIQPLMNITLFVLAALLLVVVLVVLFVARKNVHVMEFIAHFFEAFTFTRILKLLPLTILIWAFPSLMVAIIFKSVGYSISFWFVISALSMAFIFGLVSLIPGGLGVRDIILAYVYSLAGIPLEVAISVALFNRIFTILTVLGIVLLIKGFDIVTGNRMPGGVGLWEKK